jgi:hypothetical protein
VNGDAVRAPVAPWQALVALACAAAGGAAVAYAGSDAALLLVAAAVGLGATALIVRDVQWGLYAILLVLPLDIAGRIITSPVTITVFHVTLLVTIGAWLLRVSRRDPLARHEWSAVDVGVVALLLAGLWSLPFSLSPFATRIALLRVVFLIVLYMLFTTFMRDRRTMDRVLVTLVVTGSASSALAVAQLLVPNLGIGYARMVGLGGGVSVPRPSAFFDDPNYLATFLSVAVITGVARAIHARSWPRAIAWLVGAAACSSGLYVTLSRTGWVGAAIGVCIALMTAPPRRRPKLMAVAAVAVTIVIVLSPSILVERVVSIGDVTNDKSLSTRWVMVGSTLDIIRDYWVFGTGLGAYDVAYPRYREPGALYQITKLHQLPLAFPAEMGVMGLLAELLIVGGVIVVIRRRRHSGWNTWESIGVAGLVAMLVQSLFQYYLYFEYLWLFLALTVAATRLERPAEEV